MSTGAQLRDAGFQQLDFALGSAGEFWTERARAFIEALPPGQLFTADLLRENCGTPPRQNAIGMLVRRAAADGLLKRVGYQPSERAERHSAVTGLWVRTADV